MMDCCGWLTTTAGVERLEAAAAADALLDCPALMALGGMGVKLAGGWRLLDTLLDGAGAYEGVAVCCKKRHVIISLISN